MSSRVFGRPLPLPYHKHTKSGTLHSLSVCSTTMVDQLSWAVDEKSDVYLRLQFVDDMRLRCAMQDFLNGTFLPQGKINKKTRRLSNC